MTVDTQWLIYFESLKTRKRRPVKPATLAAYESYWRNWLKPSIGHLEVAVIENSVMKQLVGSLAAADLAPTTISCVINLVKDIVSSATDANGNELYPRKWNGDFIDSPVIRRNELNAPTIDQKTLHEALGKADGASRRLYALLAGSGLRIAECLSLRVGVDDGEGSFWVPEESKLVIRDQFYRGRHQKPKSDAGVREVDIDPRLNQLLKDAHPSEGYLFGGKYPIRGATLYANAKKHGLKGGFHTLRRFRRTHLENQNAPRGLAMFWMGHSMSGDVDDRYIRLEGEIEARKTWAKKVGLGFEIPRN